MKTKTIFITLILMLALTAFIFQSCGKDEEKTNTPPTCKISSPTNGQEIAKGETITISVEATDSDGSITEVRFFVNNVGMGSATSFPYNYIWDSSNESIGTHSIKGTSIDNEGGSASDEITVTIIESGGSTNTPPTAIFNVSPSSGTTSTNFTFDASGCADTEDPTSQLQVRWDFDGNGSWDTNWDTDKMANHQYSSEATYTAKLEVKDTEGLTDQYTKSITVNNGGGGTWHPVTNPATGQTWMDRNLGASRAATSSTDDQAYGDLYQWGRDTDGHEKRNSGTISTISNSDTPGHGMFITASSASDYDWRSPKNDNLWQGVNGINNPCPAGYRLPTKAEWEVERQSWSSNDKAGAFNSPLKLPVAGFRGGCDGSLGDVGSGGCYWSTTVDGIYARDLTFGSSSAFVSYGGGRAYGTSVRCIKD